MKVKVAERLIVESERYAQHHRHSPCKVNAAE